MKIYHNLRITGKYVYAVVFNDVGQAWKPASSAYVTYTTTRTDFVTQLTEIGVTGRYGPLTIPGTGPGRVWEIYVREGGTADHDADSYVGVGFESIDSNVVQLIGNTTNATNLNNIYGVVSAISSVVNDIIVVVSALQDKIGTFTGSGVNTVLGFLKALMRKDLTAPSDVGGTFTPSEDSLEAQTDGSLTIGGHTVNALKQFINVDTTLTTPIAGSVSKLSQGAATASVLLGEVITGSYPANSWGERLQRIPNAGPGVAGGLATVDANNRVKGVQDATNITSTAGVITVTAGKVTVGTNSDKVGYELDATGLAAIVNAIVTGDDWGNLSAEIINILSNTSDIYYAGLSFIKDASVDEYTVQWYKNSGVVVSGITVPTIRIIKRSDGTDLVATTALTQIGSTGSYKYDASGGGRLATGDSAVVILVATIDGSSRTWRKVIGKDIPS